MGFQPVLRTARGLALVAAILAQSALVAVSYAQQEQPVAPAPRFEIQRYDVAGNTLLTPQEVERAVAPYTGKGKDFADVQRALEALESAYRKAGYGIVQVLLPEQDITRGVVRFRVLEQRVGRVTIEGNKYTDNDNIRRSLPSVKEGVTPNSKAMSRNLQLLAEHPTKQTAISLRSAASEEQVDVNVRVTDEKPLRRFVTLDNTGTGSAGQFRLGLGFQQTNLFNRDHVLTAQYITSPENLSDVTILGLGYRIPFYETNSSLDLIAGYSNVNSGTVQGLFNVSGSGSIAAVRWNHYLPKLGEWEQKLSVGLDYRAFKNDVSIAGAQLVPDITLHPLSLTWYGLRRFPTAELSVYAAASANLAFGHDGKMPSFEASRLGAADNYTILRAGTNFAFALEGGWQGRVNINGQYTSDALVAGEQFGIGGPDSVRGYLVRETSNDRGLQAQFEMYTPEVASKLGLSDNFRIRFLGFFDVGAVSRNKTQIGEVEDDSLASLGVGLRLNYQKSVSVRLDIAQPMQPTPNRATSSTRIHGALAVVF